MNKLPRLLANYINTNLSLITFNYSKPILCHLRYVYTVMTEQGSLWLTANDVGYISECSLFWVVGLTRLTACSSGFAAAVSSPDLPSGSSFTGRKCPCWLSSLLAFPIFFSHPGQFRDLKKNLLSVIYCQSGHMCVCVHYKNKISKRQDLQYRKR